MGGAVSTKICPFCSESIKAAAKLCPHCRSKQVRNALLRQELILGIPVVVLITAAFSMIVYLGPDENGAGGRQFAGHRQELLVQDTALVADAKKPDFWLTGIVTNQGDYPWRVHELEVRFLDGKENLLDVCHPKVRDSFVVQSHQEHAFRVDLDTTVVTNNAVIRQVRVQMATDGNRRWKPD